MKYNYVVIEGNIGSGKTSLSSRISKEFNARLILERFDENPFLPKFYLQPKEYAFPLELSFLAERFQHLKDQLLAQELFSSFTVSDYMFDKCLIFAGVNLDADEYSLYNRFFSMMNSLLPKPELLVYLHTDIPRLLQNIKKRGRSFEQGISEEYLRKVESGYLKYFSQHPNQKIVIIDITDKDFVKNNADYDEIINIIQSPQNRGINRY